MSDQSAFSGQSDYVMTPDDHSKKPSLFGKLKDRTKKAGSKIKHKVKKDNHDGTGVEHDDDEGAYSDEEESPISSPPGAASRGYTTSEPSRFGAHKSEAPIPGMSGLSLNEPAPASSYKSYDEPSYTVPQSSPYNEPSYTDTSSKPYNEPSYTDTSSKPYNEPSYTDTSSKPYGEPSYDEPKSAYPESTPYPSQEPSLTDKAAGTGQGAKDSVYGGAAATAGALGLGGAKHEYDENKPYSEKASDSTYDAGSKVEEVGNRGYDAATDAKDNVAGQTQDTFGYPGSEPTATDTAASKAYETKDAAQSKAYDINNASNDSETYTDKASNTPKYAKDATAGALGIGAATEGPSLVEKAKQTMGFDSTPGYGEPTAAEKAKNALGYGTTTPGYTEPTAAEKAKDAVGYDSTPGYGEPTMTEKAKNAMGYGTTTPGYTEPTVAEKAKNALGYGTTTPGYTEPTAAEKAKDAVGYDSTPGYGEPTMTEKAKNALGYGTTTPGYTEPTVAEKTKNALGLGEPTATEKAKDAVGYDSTPGYGEPTVAEKAKNALGYGTTTPGYTEPTVAEKAKNALGLGEPTATEKAQWKADEAKDTVQSKAADVNYATDDSQTYTQKAANAVTSAKDSAAAALGVNQSPSYTGTTQPSLVEQAKDTMGLNKPGPSVADTTKAYAASAKDTAVDTATPKREDKALSEKITEALGGLPGRAQATAAGATQPATTPGTITDANTGHVDEPASPGILGKLGGLFGYGAKAPEHHDPTHTGLGSTTTTGQHDPALTGVGPTSTTDTPTL